MVKLCRFFQLFFGLLCYKTYFWIFIVLVFTSLFNMLLEFIPILILKKICSEGTFPNSFFFNQELFLSNATSRLNLENTSIENLILKNIYTFFLHTVSDLSSCLGNFENTKIALSTSKFMFNWPMNFLSFNQFPAKPSQSGYGPSIK